MEQAGTGWSMTQEYLGLLRAKLNLLNKIVIDFIWGFVCFSLSRVRLFCDPMDCSPPGPPVHGISQTRIVEWVAISPSRGSSQPRD